jgi:hypothetical protein
MLLHKTKSVSTSGRVLRVVCPVKFRLRMAELHGAVARDRSVLSRDDNLERRCWRFLDMEGQLDIGVAAVRI